MKRRRKREKDLTKHPYCAIILDENVDLCLFIENKNVKALP